MSEGFLGRWSRRKLDARDGKPLPEPPPVEPEQEPAPVATPPDAAPVVDAAPRPEPAPLPTLEDVQALTTESDFSRFAARDVPADVKNAALKKLFSDPRFNVMDGLDVYIDDYTKTQPLPAHLVSQLAGAAFLRLIDAPPTPPTGRGPRDVSDDQTIPPVAQSGTAEPLSSEDADPDLRLQQDDAAGRGEPGADAA